MPRSFPIFFLLIALIIAPSASAATPSTAPALLHGGALDFAEKYLRDVAKNGEPWKWNWDGPCAAPAFSEFFRIWCNPAPGRPGEGLDAPPAPSDGAGPGGFAREVLDAPRKLPQDLAELFDSKATDSKTPTTPAPKRQGTSFDEYLADFLNAPAGAGDFAQDVAQAPTGGNDNPPPTPPPAAAPTPQTPPASAPAGNPTTTPTDGAGAGDCATALSWTTLTPSRLVGVILCVLAATISTAFQYLSDAILAGFNLVAGGILAGFALVGGAFDFLARLLEGAALQATRTLGLVYGVIETLTGEAVASAGASAGPLAPLVVAAVYVGVGATFALIIAGLYRAGRALAFFIATRG